MEGNTTIIVYGLGALVVAIAMIVMAVTQQRTTAAFTNALKEIQQNPQLIDQLHKLAVEVVPVDTLNKALEVIQGASQVATAITPDDIDAAINEAVALLRKVGRGNSDLG